MVGEQRIDIQKIPFRRKLAKGVLLGCVLSAFYLFGFWESRSAFDLSHHNYTFENPQFSVRVPANWSISIKEDQTEMAFFTWEEPKSEIAVLVSGYDLPNGGKRQKFIEDVRQRLFKRALPGHCQATPIKVGGKSVTAYLVIPLKATGIQRVRYALVQASNQLLLLTIIQRSNRHDKELARFLEHFEAKTLMFPKPAPRSIES